MSPWKRALKNPRIEISFAMTIVSQRKDTLITKSKTISE